MNVSVNFLMFLPLSGVHQKGIPTSRMVQVVDCGGNQCGRCMLVLDELANWIGVEEIWSCLEYIGSMCCIVICIAGLVICFDNSQPFVKTKICRIIGNSNEKLLKFCKTYTSGGQCNASQTFHRSNTFWPRLDSGWWSVTLSNSITSKSQNCSRSRTVIISVETRRRPALESRLSLSPIMPLILLPAETRRWWWSRKASTTERFRCRFGWCNWFGNRIFGQNLFNMYVCIIFTRINPS